MAHELNDADRAILDYLEKGRDEGRPWGRELPTNLSDSIGYSRQYVQNRLQLLTAAGYVRNRGGGLYEITPAGERREPPVPDEDVPEF